MEDVTRLVSIDAAKAHIRAESNVAATEREVEEKLDAATAFVVRACGALADEDWDETNVPAPVHTAILLHLSDLFTDRGDNDDRKTGIGEAAIRYLIASGYRDTVVA